MAEKPRAGQPKGSPMQEKSKARFRSISQSNRIFQFSRLFCLFLDSAILLTEPLTRT